MKKGMASRIGRKIASTTSFMPKTLGAVLPKPAVALHNRVIMHPKFMPAFQSAYRVARSMVSEGADVKRKVRSGR